VRLAAGFLDEKLVFRRTPGVFARLDHDLSVGAEQPFASTYRVLHQLRGREIAMDRRDAIEAERGEIGVEAL
jgi:hypothetical protein